jgi:hypothetical protein
MHLFAPSASTTFPRQKRDAPQFKRTPNGARQQLMRLSTAAQFSTPERPLKGTRLVSKTGSAAVERRSPVVMRTENRSKSATDSGEDPFIFSPRLSEGELRDFHVKNN